MTKYFIKRSLRPIKVKEKDMNNELKNHKQAKKICNTFEKFLDYNDV